MRIENAIEIKIIQFFFYFFSFSIWHLAAQTSANLPIQWNIEKRQSRKKWENIHDIEWALLIFIDDWHWTERHWFPFFSLLVAFSSCHHFHSICGIFFLFVSLHILFYFSCCRCRCRHHWIKSHQFEFQNLLELLKIVKIFSMQSKWKLFATHSFSPFGFGINNDDILFSLR